VTLGTYKKYKQLIHHAAGIQCLQCQKLFTREEFSIHLPDCKKHMMRQSTLHAAIAINPFKIRITDCKYVLVKPKIKEKPLKSQNRYDDKPDDDISSDEDVSFEQQQSQYVFCIEVNNRGEITTLDKSVDAVKELFKLLELQFPGQQVPDAIEIAQEIDLLI
jgi:hypothetical protein